MSRSPETEPSVRLPRLREVGPAARALLTAFLLTIAVAFAFGQVTNHATHAGLDGEPGPSIDDVVIAFHGRPGSTLLASKVSPGGSMEKYVPLPSERELVVDWASDGAPADGFDAVAAVLERRCVRCHNPNGEMASVPFSNSRAGGAELELVRRTTVPDQGKSVAALGRSTHAHLFGMGTLFTLAGLVFLMTDVSPRGKVVCVTLPFVAMLVDIGCWWLTRWEPAFAWGIVLGGIALGVAFAVLVLRPLWELWIPRRGG